MRLKRLRVSNAKQYLDVDIDLSRVRLASIIGNYTFNRAKSNGAGKSTLGDLIMYALFETVPDKSLSVSDLVSWGEIKMSVELLFEYESNLFLVKRTHTPEARTKNTMELEINGVPHGKDILERRKILAKHLGISDQIAQATWFFQQSGANKLTSADPKDRKEYLAAVLDADKYERAYVYAKEKLGVVERDIEQSRKSVAQLEDLKASIVDANQNYESFDSRKLSGQQYITEQRERLESMNSKLAVLASQRIQSESEQALAAKANEIRAGLANSQKMKSEADNQLIEHQATTQAAVLSLQELERSKRQADIDLAGIVEKWKQLGYEGNFLLAVNKYVWDFRTRASGAKQKVEEIRKKIGGVAKLDLNCPACKQIVDDQHRAKLTADMEQEIRDTEIQMAADEQQLRSMHENETLAQEDDMKLKHARDILKSYDVSSVSLERDIQSAPVVEQNIRQQIVMLDEQISRSRTDLAATDQKIEEAKRLASTDDSAVISERDTLAQDIDKAQQKVEELTSSAAKWQSHLESLQSQQQQLEQAAGNLPALEDDLKVRKSVVQLFHRDGLPLHKINSACVLIEAYANSMMSTVLPNYHVKVVVESGKRGKLDFMVQTPGGLQPYAVMSGGEKAIAGICLRMALSRILAEGSGHRFETLFLDEVFSQLDQVYRPVMMNLVKELSKSFKAIFVISHELEIQTAFPQVVLVECDGKESHVQVLANNEVE